MNKLNKGYVEVIHKSADMRKVTIVNIEDLVPKNHLLRKVEKVIDFNRVY